MIICVKGEESEHPWTNIDPFVTHLHSRERRRMILCSAEH